jgi:alpha-1,3-glucosyltransferase
MVSRLFPFSRGLNHAYWAANVWALYTFADRVLIKVMHVKSQYGNATRGIIGDTNFDVLPAISAGHCFLLTLTFSVLLCTRLWQRPTYASFVESIGLFGLTSFLFGFHVHEKAILIALLPLTLLSHTSFTMMRKTLVLSVAGIVGLFPLLYEARELPIKLLYTATWLLLVPLSSTFGMRFTSSTSTSVSLNTPTNWDLLVHFAEDIYVAGFLFLVAFVELVHPLLLTSKHVAVNAGGGMDTAFDSATKMALSAAEAVSSAAMPASAAESAGLFSAASSAASQASAAASAFLATSTASMVQGHALMQKVHPTVLADAATMEFLPLMMTSVYCAIGIVWVYISLAAHFLLNTSDQQHTGSDSTSGNNRSKTAKAKKS